MGGLLCVELEQVRDDLLLVAIEVDAIRPFYRRIEFAMRRHELGEEGLIDLSDRTEMTFTGMANGIYKLSETTAPPGYIILTKDIYFRVSDGAVTLTDSFGNPKTYSNVNLIDNNSTIVVKNALGKPLPSTGGPGTKHIYLIGCILTLFAGAGIIMKRKWREAA